MRSAIGYSPPLGKLSIDEGRRVTVTPFLHSLNDLARGVHRFLTHADLKDFVTTKLMRVRFQKYKVISLSIHDTIISLYH